MLFVAGVCGWCPHQPQINFEVFIHGWCPHEPLTKNNIYNKNYQSCQQPSAISHLPN